MTLPPAARGDRAPEAGRHRQEIDLGPLGGVSDRGLRHRDNEDAMSLAVVPGALVAVVCDGVSSAPGSAAASRAAADTARRVLVDGLAGAGDHEGPGDGTGIPALMGRAVAAAQAAVAEVPMPDPRSAPSSTLAAAVVTGRQVTVGWIGDSRVYLVDDEGPELLTADDTWAAEAARAGIEVPSGGGFGAHALTRWLGANAGEGGAHLVAVTAAGPAWLIVCSDGLWNYAPEPAAIGALVASAPPHVSPAALAAHLTAFALRSGGHDNITAAVARFGD